MKRTVISLSTICFTLASAAVSAGWLHSYWYCDSVAGTTQNKFHYFAASVTGRLFLERWDERRTRYRQPWPFHFDSDANEIEMLFPLWMEKFDRKKLIVDRFGFALFSGTRNIAWGDTEEYKVAGNTTQDTMIVIPDWSIMGLPLVAAIAGWWSLWRMRRAGRAGECVNCGYDLRASTARCPECGTYIARICRVRKAGAMCQV